MFIIPVDFLPKFVEAQVLLCINWYRKKTMTWTKHTILPHVPSKFWKCALWSLAVTWALGGTPSLDLFPSHSNYMRTLCCLRYLIHRWDLQQKFIV